MNTARVNAYAKINLTLDITGRENGFHMLDSLVCTVDLYDKIVAHRRKDRQVRVAMHGMGSEHIPPEQNNAYKAAERFVNRFGTCGAEIAVYKNIPVGAGLGGSSADAAGVLNALARLYEIEDETALKDIADEMGSDTGYLLGGGFARISGRGDEVLPLGAAPEWNLLLIAPQRGVSTSECYALCDAYADAWKRRSENALRFLRAGNLSEFALQLGNDLFPAASKLNQDVARALEEAKSFSPLTAVMTGSGSAVFALFENEELCAWARSRYRGKFRTYVLKTVDPKQVARRTVRNPFVL